MNASYFYPIKQRGITLIELIVGVAILTLISAVAMTAMADFRSRVALDASTEKVLAAFSAAHLDTISSRNDAVYGVRIYNDRVVYFSGTTYPGDGAVGNVVYTLPPMIEIANISLNGGGVDVYYKRLTGATENYGSFQIRSKAKTTIMTTVTINQTGIGSI